MASLREYANFAGQQGKLLTGYKLPTLGQEFAHPLPGLGADLQKMLNACRTPMQRALIAFLGLEGMRLHEALELSTDRFDLGEMTITVVGKGNKTRIIPITTRAWEYIAPRLITVQLEGGSRLVCYSDRGARHFITELGVRAEIARPVASHDLRATFATLAYRHTKDIVLVQHWLGHSDIKTTQTYIGISLGQMRQAGSF